MNRDKIKYRKIEILNTRKEKKLTQKQLERRCFWTYPFGHVWPEVCINDATCLICGKQIYGLGDPY